MGIGLKLLFEKEVIINQGTNLGSQIGRWIILAALVALLGALLLTIRPVVAQDEAPSLATAKSVHYYPENHTTLAVHSYSVREPDNDKVFWTLSGTDAASFTIEGGKLRFKSQPNYEVPNDRERAAVTEDLTADPPVLGATFEAGRDNTYRVTVRSSGGGEGGEPGSEADTPPDDHDGNDLDELEVTVHVTNVDEDGKVNLSSLQPQVGTTLTATVSDPDGVTIVGSWQWASSYSMNGPFEIPEQSNRQTYQPTDDDLGKYLRVTAMYRDNASKVDSDIREEMAVSSHTVRKDVISSNEPPKIPDQKTLLGGNDIVRNNTERFIRENSPAGTNVGAPVTAFDDNTELEVLTYSLIGAHKGSFNIHQVTGQITVSAAAKLNAEADQTTTPPTPGGAATPYRVTVVATDGDGEKKTVDVVIRVVGYNEPPRITDGAREMTHWEVDRTDRSATTIDTDLDSSVIFYSGTPPTPDGTVDFANYQDAIYRATDPDAADRVGGVITGSPTVMWSLAGDDAEKFFIYTNTVNPAEGTTNPDARTIAEGAVTIDTFDDFDDIVGHLENTGDSARLAFKAGPDFEVKGDKNKDNVYEVTIVATDSVGNMSEYPVTVKVKNSTDDNKPGKVTILNRQPEIKARLEAKLVDLDGGLTKVKWQWYRSVAAGTDRNRCETANGPYDPHGEADPSMAVRYFIDGPPNPDNEDPAPTIADAWQAIPGATGSGVNAHYTPGYDARVDGRELGPGDDGVDELPNTVQWVGGDINVVITTTPADATATPPTREFKAYNWTAPKCLRVAFMYEDGVDRTHAEQDDLDTTAVDETMEGAFKGSEFPVKRPDDRNDAPVFTMDGMIGGKVVSRYQAERKENVEPYEDPGNTADGATRRINEAFSATDTEEHEDDDSDADRNPPADGTADNADSAGTGPGPDILTYSLSGTDAKYFKITGTADTRATGEYNPDDDDTDVGGILSIKSMEELKASGLPDLDFETKRVLTVIITVADPSGDKKASVTVTVDLTDYNEMPNWIGTSPTRVVYAENRTDAVAQYKAKDPETTVNYGLVKVQDANVRPVIADTDVGADHARFSIDPLTGILRFKSSPNYEKPGDGTHDTNVVDNTRDNIYEVTVSATVADNPPLTPTGDPEGPHVIIRKVKVVVTDVNEAPEFAESTDTLMITENPDDPEKEPPAVPGYEYLLNRGVGKPAANLPAAPNLDVGIPVAAADDDSTATFPIGSYTDATTRDRIDGLTYTLSGTDAGYFHIVPATGQILTKIKLDYEAKKNEYKVTVTATDPDGESDSIDMTIKVTNLDEPNVPKALLISGGNSHTVEENSTDALGEYTVAAGGGASANPNWTLEGADAGNFMLEGTGNSRMLKFSSPPDFDTPMGGANDGANTYMVTIKVTDPSDSNVTDDHIVTVTVTDVDELGALSGDASLTQAENGTDAMGTYTLTEITDGPAVTWSLDGTDMGDFMLEGTGMSRMLKFKSAPDYESPMGGADDNSNTYMVTVMAEAGGETDMVEVTVTVTDVDELGTLSGPTSVSVMEGATDALGHYTLSGVDGSNAQFSLDGADADYFMIDGSLMLKFSSAPDYEMPRGQALSDTNTNTYMVTVMAKAGGEMEMVEVTITVDNVEEAGTVILNTESPVVDGEVTATLSDLDGSISNVTWTWQTSSDDATWIAATGEATDAGTTSTYMPVEADAGRYLRATASYTDGYDADNSEMSESAMVVAADVNVAPAFASETATRSIPENTAANTNIGDPFTATDPNGDTLTYSLEGTDAASFSVVSGTGQLRTLAALDYETKMTYTVVVKADDGELSDTIEVTINVTDVDDSAVTPTDPVDTYNTNGIAGIQIDELFEAIDDYFEDGLSISELFEVIDAYFNG